MRLSEKNKTKPPEKHKQNPQNNKKPLTHLTTPPHTAFLKFPGINRP